MTISFVREFHASSAAAGTALSLTLSVSPQAGNGLMCVISCNTNDSVPTPAGWTALGTQTVDTTNLASFWKNAAGTETTIAVTLAAAASWNIHYIEFHSSNAQGGWVNGAFVNNVPQAAGTVLSTGTTPSQPASAAKNAVGMAKVTYAGALQTPTWAGSYTANIDSNSATTVFTLSTAYKIISASGTQTTSDTVGVSVASGWTGQLGFIAEPTAAAHAFDPSLQAALWHPLSPEAILQPIWPVQAAPSAGLQVVATLNVAVGPSATAVLGTTAVSSANAAVGEVATVTTDRTATARETAAVASSGVVTTDRPVVATEGVASEPVANVTIDFGPSVATENIAVAGSAAVTRNVTAVATESVAVSPSDVVTLGISGSASESVAVAPSAVVSRSTDAVASETVAVAPTGTAVTDRVATAVESVAVAGSGSITHELTGTATETIAVAGSGTTSASGSDISVTASLNVGVSGSAAFTTGITAQATTAVAVSGQGMATTDRATQATATTAVASSATVTTDQAFVAILTAALSGRATDTGEPLATPPPPPLSPSNSRRGAGRSWPVRTIKLNYQDDQSLDLTDQQVTVDEWAQLLAAPIVYVRPAPLLPLPTTDDELILLLS